MKVWITKKPLTHSDYNDVYCISAIEPEWDSLYLEWLADDLAWLDVEKDERCMVNFGFKILPSGYELIEYDLSGKTPRYICTWLPMFVVEK